MKLLEPFAGYRLASGSPVFHLAFFLASFFVRWPGNDDHLDNDYVGAFQALRQAHIVISTMMGISFWLRAGSEIKPAKDDFDEK